MFKHTQTPLLSNTDWSRSIITKHNPAAQSPDNSAPQCTARRKKGTRTQLNWFLSHFFPTFFQGLSLSLHVSPPFVHHCFFQSALRFETVLVLARFFCVVSQSSLCKSICDRTCLWLRKRTRQRSFFFHFVCATKTRGRDEFNPTLARQCHLVATRRRHGQRKRLKVVLINIKQKIWKWEFGCFSLKGKKYIHIYVCI